MPLLCWQRFLDALARLRFKVSTRSINSESIAFVSKIAPTEELPPFTVAFSEREHAEITFEDLEPCCRDVQTVQTLARASIIDATDSLPGLRAAGARASQRDRRHAARDNGDTGEPPATNSSRATPPVPRFPTTLPAARFAPAPAPALRGEDTMEPRAAAPVEAGPTLRVACAQRARRAGYNAKLNADPPVGPNSFGQLSG